MRPDRVKALIVTAVAGALAAVSLALPSPWDLLAVAPWAFAIGGPLALWLVQPALVADARAWPRTMGLALPGLALAASLRESLNVVTSVIAPDVTLRQWALLALHVAWFATVTIFAARAAWRAERADRWPILAFALAALLMAMVADLMPALLALEAAGLVAVSRFERPGKQWARAGVAASVVLAAGFAGLWLAAERPWPPHVAVGQDAFHLGVMPTLAGAGLVFVTMMLWPPASNGAGAT